MKFTPDCHSCYFFDWMAKSDDKDEGWGLCHRYPPKALDWTDEDQIKSELTARWPCVNDTDWCGEYREIPKVNNQSAGPEWF